MSPLDLDPDTLNLPILQRCGVGTQRALPVGVSYPRQILPGATYLITRRCTQRQFLLRPCSRTNDILLYCLARAAALYGVELHAYCFLSNHYHLVLTDPRARLPEFMRYLNEHTARALNALHGRWEALWASGTYSAVRLATLDDVVEKVAYTLANPVAAGLVERGERWPGLWSHPRNVGRAAVIVGRPEGGFFRPNGPTPEYCELALVLPSAAETLQGYVEAVQVALRHHEDAAVRDARGRSHRFLGRSGVLAQCPTDSPSVPEPRRDLNPRVAARDRWRRIEALTRLRSFVDAYRTAREALLAGLANVLFPTGTYWLRVYQRVACAPP